MAGDIPASDNIQAIGTSSQKNSSAGSHHLENHHIIDKHLSFGASSDGEGDSDDNSGGVDAVSLRSPKVDFNEIRRSMCMMVIKDGLSFNTSEKAGFKVFMSAMCPRFNLPCADDLMSDALNYSIEERKIVEEELQKAPGRICFTVDNLRDSFTGDYCMCLTAHWVDCDWILQRRMIKFEILEPPFDGDSLSVDSVEIKLCLDKWKISDKVFGFTIDDPSYADSMMSSLEAHFQETNSLVLGGQFFRISCAHKIINLAVRSSLNLFNDILDKIRSIVQHIRAFTSKKERFYEAASSSFGLDTSKRLTGDTRARWDSTFVMLDRFLHLREAIDSFVSKDTEIEEFALTQVEWGRVTELFNFLKVFYDVINTYLAPKTPTANIYFYVMWRILRNLSDVSNGPPGRLSAMAKKLQERFDKYWSDHCCILSCAAVLDPRYKLDRVEFCYEKLYGEAYAKEMIGKVKKTLSGLFDEYKKVVGKPNIVPRGDMELNDYENYVTFLSKRSKLEEKSELGRYLEDWMTDFNKDMDVLEYWKSNSKRFPCLSCLARDILSVPVSTVAMKSSFSTVKNFRCVWRKSMPLETMESLVCYQDWLRAKGSSKASMGSPFYGYNDDDLEEESDYERESKNEDKGEYMDEDEDKDGSEDKDEDEDEDEDGSEDEDEDEDICRE